MKKYFYVVWSNKLMNNMLILHTVLHMVHMVLVILHKIKNVLICC